MSTDMLRRLTNCRLLLLLLLLPFSLVINRAKHVLSCTCLWAYLKSITVTVLVSLTKCALHFANTKLHRPLSLMRALWGRMKMPPWLNILSTGADVAGTQYIRLTK